MNGFTAADMSTAAANGHAEGYQAGYADAVKALDAAQPAAEQEPIGYRWRHSASEAWQYSNFPCGWEHQPLYAAPVAAAPVVRRAIADEAPFGLSTAEKVAWARGVNDALEYISTPAAPGIDLEQFREAVDCWESVNRGARDCGVLVPELQKDAQENIDKAIELLALIDASPKGGDEPVATLTIGEVGGEGATQAYFIDRIRETEAFGKLPPGTYHLAVCSMQATSAEVGA